MVTLESEDKRMISQNSILLESARYVAIGDVERAVATLRDALANELPPEQRSELHAAMGMAYEGSGRYEEALESFSSGVIISSTPWCRLHVGRMLARLGRLTQTELEGIRSEALATSRNVKLIDQYIEEILSVWNPC